MNFVSNLKDIQDKLFRRSRFPGCYVYSKDVNDTQYKLGMSETNLFDRVKQSKFCFPNGNEFFIHMFIVCHDKSVVRDLEKKLLAESKNLTKIKVETESGIPEQGIRSTEYRLTTDRKSLGSAVKDVLAENRTLWDEVIVFGKKGWTIHTKSLKSLDVSTSKTMYAIEPFKPLKVGDSVYVILPKGVQGIPSISNQGKITKQYKYRYQVHWNSKPPETRSYPFNEVYKTKKESVYAINYWYKRRP